MKSKKSILALALIPTLLSVTVSWAQAPRPTSTPLPTLPPLPQPTGAPTSQPTSQPLVSPTPTTATFADDAFRSTWARTDQLVVEGTVRRSFYWGPQPNTGGLQEDYAEGAGGKHLVQYFDKSRMEINDPKADKNNPFYVTNGLLAEEMILGRMQVGNTQFVDRYSAQIPLASDTDDTTAPTYASFRDAFRSQTSNRVNNPVNSSIDRDGNTTTISNTFGVKYAYFEAATKHNIPDIFWTFLNDSGPVVVNVQGTPAVRHARLTDPYFYATGYPITEAYWAKVKIAGVTGVDVLIQPYERRVLTYVPSLPEGFKVQVGNIGQHYYDWRYKNAGNLLDVPLSCGSLISRAGGIGKLWSENQTARRQLGCPSDTGGPGTSVTIASQQFEHGQMLDVIAPGASGQPAQKTIYVMYEDGTMQRFADAFVDGSPDPTPSEEPPTGFIAPLHGFGKVWNENPAVKQRLGWAAQAEQVFSNSLFVQFDRGISLSPNSAQNQIYVLYDDKALSAKDANRWVVYGGGQ